MSKTTMLDLFRNGDNDDLIKFIEKYLDKNGDFSNLYCDGNGNCPEEDWLEGLCPFTRECELRCLTQRYFTV